MRLYELLLRLYPASFRSEYGPELRRLYAARQRGVSSRLTRLALFLGEALDVLRNAPGVHLDILRQDLRYAVRTLGRAPAFAGTAVVAAALGIGANTAAFSVADHVLLRPLPYAGAQRLVKLWESGPEYTRNDVSPANYRDWRRLATNFEEMGAYTFVSANLVGEGEPRRIDGVSVTSELLPLLGVRPVLGRLFAAEDDREGAAGTVLLSYSLWQQVFGGSREVVGRTVRLNDETFGVIGVLPQDFPFPSRRTQLWTPLRLGAESYADRDDTYLRVLGKLKPSVSLEQARAEMDLVARQLEQQHPIENAREGVSVLRLRDEVPRQTRLLIVALSGAALCVLLIACTNLANLLLARALARRRELSVRAARGAGSERLVRQLLTESLVLSFLGGVLGIVLALPAATLLAALVPTSLPIGSATALDVRVLAFAAGLTVLTGIGFGVVPALRICRGTDFGGLREGPRGGAAGARNRLRRGLVLAEIAATVVLLVSAGLLIRALLRVQATDPGFRGEGVMAVRTPLALPKYDGTARRAEFYSRVLSEVRSLPGITNAAYITDLPMLRRGGIWAVTVPGETFPPGSAPSVSLRYVTPGFFDVLSIPLHSGRDISDADTAASPFVAVVSESFVRRHWPGQDPVGKVFNVANADRTVIAVAGDIRVRGLEQSSEPQVYLPCTQVPDGSLIGYVPREMVYRASTDPGSLVASVRGIVAKADPELPVSDVRTLRSIVEAESEPRRTQLRALGAFAALALLLAGIGVHGLLAYAVSQRTAEFGVRIALGARPGSILTMVLREGLGLAALGGLAGALAGYGTGRMMEALLAGVPPADAATFLVAGAVVFATAASGSLVPALRAARVDPATALRAE